MLGDSIDSIVLTFIRFPKYIKNIKSYTNSVSKQSNWQT